MSAQRVIRLKFHSLPTHLTPSGFGFKHSRRLSGFISHGQAPFRYRVHKAGRGLYSVADVATVVPSDVGATSNSIDEVWGRRASSVATGRARDRAPDV